MSLDSGSIGPNVYVDIRWGFLERASSDSGVVDNGYFQYFRWQSVGNEASIIT